MITILYDLYTIDEFNFTITIEISSLWGILYPICIPFEGNFEIDWNDGCITYYDGSDPATKRHKYDQTFKLSKLKLSIVTIMIKVKGVFKQFVETEWTFINCTYSCVHKLICKSLIANKEIKSFDIINNRTFIKYSRNNYKMHRIDVLLNYLNLTNN